MPIVMIFIAVIIVVAGSTPASNAQGSNDAVALSFQTFSRVAAIYRSGGQAPNLVAKLNLALELIQQAEFKRSQGDNSTAIELQRQAKATRSAVESEIPAAQTEASRESADRILFVGVSAAAVIVLSTFCFCALLLVRRAYEKMKLFEMRIVEEKTED